MLRINIILILYNSSLIFLHLLLSPKAPGSFLSIFFLHVQSVISLLFLIIQKLSLRINWKHLFSSSAYVMNKFKPSHLCQLWMTGFKNCLKTALMFFYVNNQDRNYVCFISHRWTWTSALAAITHPANTPLTQCDISHSSNVKPDTQ